jgi:hypothetical protein
MHRGARPKVILRGQDLRLNARTQNDSKFCLSAILHSTCHRGRKGREERARVFLSLRPSRSIHHDFSGDSTKNSFLVIVYSALFYIVIVIEALNLVLEKIFSRNPPALQYLLSIPQSSAQSSDMACHWRFPSHHMSSWAFWLKPWGMTRPFKLQSQCKSCSPASFLKLIWARWLSGVILWPLGLCVMYYHNPCTLYLPHEWKYEKKGGFRSREYSVSGPCTVSSYLFFLSRFRGK